MKKVAIIYPEFFVGGTTTSLIFLLNSLDYSKVDVDLLVYKNEGELKHNINHHVNIVDVGLHISKISMFFCSLFSGKLFLLFVKTLFKKDFLKHFRMGISQLGAFYRSKKSKVVEKKYDLAIGFMEFWANEYLLCVDSKKRNMIIHPNYSSACFNLFLDLSKFEAVNNISFVSKSNCDSFNVLTNNKFYHKVMLFPNILDKQTILNMSSEMTDISIFKDTCLLVTSARIESYVKGFDRMIDVALELKNKGFAFKWLVVGGGADEKTVKKKIVSLGIEKFFIFFGQQINPYKYMALADYFVLLSRREGRPMSVDEAIILGRKCVVTSYETANEQLNNGQYGFVVSNEKFSAKLVADIISNDYLDNKGNGINRGQSDLLIRNKKIVEDYIYEN